MIKVLPTKILLLAFLICCSVHAAMAQARFTATITPSVIGKNETAELKLMVEDARQVDQIIPPSLTDFVIVSGPNQESSMQSINGVVKQYIGYTYELQPKAKGTFNLDAAIARADGKVLKSNRLTVQVTTAPTGNSRQNNNNAFGGLSPFFDEPEIPADNKDLILKKGENIQAKIDKNLFIKVAKDKSSCYVGEPVVVTYKLYTRLKSETNIVQNPSFNGFSVIDLSQPGSTFYTTETFNGRQYNVYTLRKAQLYPLQAGTIELEAAEVENNIHFVKDEYLRSQQGSGMLNIWGISGLPPEALHDEKVTLQSKPVNIDVKPLPDSNRPVSFKGAVGNFTIASAVEKNKFTTDDAGKYQVLITGQGNMELINAPDIVWPEGIEGYEPKVTDALNKQAVPVSGNKVYDYGFTVSKPGAYTLPSIVYSFFDPGLKMYKTIVTKPVTITVAQGTGKHIIAKDNTPVKSGKERFFDTMFNNRLWIVIPVALLIFAGLFFWIRRENNAEKKKADMDMATKKKAAVIAADESTGNPLSITEAKLVSHDGKGFYEALNTELKSFLSSHLPIPADQINKKRLPEELDKKGIPVDVALQVQQLLNEVEWQLYTPVKDESKMAEMYQSANTIVHAFKHKNEG